MLFAGDADLYGSERHFVVRPDHEDTLDVLLADFLRGSGAAETVPRYPPFAISSFSRTVSAMIGIDRTLRRVSVMTLAVAEKSGRVSVRRVRAAGW